MKRALVLCATLALLAGCTSMAKVQPLTGLTLSQNVNVTVLGDTEGTASGLMLLGIIPIGVPAQAGVLGASGLGLPNPVVDAAAYNAIEKIEGADYMIAPRWTIETKCYIVYSKVTATVKGKAVKIEPQ